MQKLKKSGMFQTLRANKGSALVGTIAFSIILFIASLGYLKVLASTRDSELESLRDDNAFIAAESGLLLGTRWQQLQAWPAEYQFGSVNTVYSGLPLNGMTVEVKDSIDINGRVFLISTAKSVPKLRYVKKIVWEVRSHPFDTNAFNYAMISGDTFSIRGNTLITQLDGITPGAIHSNAAIDINGSASLGDSTHIIDVTSSISISTGNNNEYINVKAPSLSLFNSGSMVFGTQTKAAVPTVPIPDIDLSPWFTEASANGAVVTGNINNPLPPASGTILWVNGDVTLNHGNFNFQIIATGSITLLNTAKVIAPAGGFALASQNGDISINPSQGADVTGLIYVKTGNYNQQANGTVHAQVIANGTISKGGVSTVNMSIGSYIPIAPGRSQISIKPGTWLEASIPL